MTTAVLLAAGAGRRLGLGPKALLTYRGTTLVEYLAAVLRDGGCDDVVIVLGSAAKTVRAATDLSGYRVVDNPEWDAGLSTSLRVGVTAAPREKAPTATEQAEKAGAEKAPAGNVGEPGAGGGLLVALVDQPGLTPSMAASLVTAHRPGRITAAGFRGTDGVLVHGHPIVFDTAMIRAAAAAATGDAGARALLRARPDLIDVVDCGDQSAGRDVDTPEDLSLLDK